MGGPLLLMQKVKGKVFVAGFVFLSHKQHGGDNREGKPEACVWSRVSALRSRAGCWMSRSAFSGLFAYRSALHASPNWARWSLSGGFYETRWTLVATIQLCGHLKLIGFLFVLPAAVSGFFNWLLETFSQGNSLSQPEVSAPSCAFWGKKRVSAS